MNDTRNLLQSVELISIRCAESEQPQSALPTLEAFKSIYHSEIALEGLRW